MRQSLPLRGFRFDLVRFGQRREQRLRLGDLWHFRRRRKAFERGREDGVGFGGAGGRLIELGERKRRAQFETARALLLRDGDGGQEGFFRRRGVGGIALEQDFAACPMQFRFERAMPVRRTSPALRPRSQGRDRDRPPALRPRRARSSSAHRTTERSVRARSSTPRRMFARPSLEGPGVALAQPSKNTLNAQIMTSSCSCASRANSRAFAVARASLPRINSNIAAFNRPIPCVPRCGRRPRAAPSCAQ